MEIKFTEAQVMRALKHIVGITNIIAEASSNAYDEHDKQEADKARTNFDLIPDLANYPFEPDTKSTAELDNEYHQIFSNEIPANEDYKLKMVGKIGDWINKGKKSEVSIFRAAPGFMIAFREPRKKYDKHDCYLIERDNDNLGYYKDHRFNIITHDIEKDILTLWPGGEYTRVFETKK